MLSTPLPISDSVRQDGKGNKEQEWKWQIPCQLQVGAGGTGSTVGNNTQRHSKDSIRWSPGPSKNTEGASLSRLE
jgi:hypothetical protein